MIETERVLPKADLFRLRIGGEEDSQPEGIVLFGRTIWAAPGREQYNRYGVAFLRGQADSYERLRRLREVAHARGVAETLGCMFVDLTPSMVEKRALSYINRDLAFSLNCMPIKVRGERLMVAMAEPADPTSLKKLQLYSQCKIVPVVATPSAIRNALIYSWRAEYVPPASDMSAALSFGMPRQKRRPRIVALVSSTPDFGGRRLAVNLAAVLNRDNKRALLTDLGSGSPAFSDVLSGPTAEHCEWMIVTVPMDTSASCLEWVIRADEAFLVVSPSHWRRGCLYLEVVFDRLLKLQKDQRTSYPERPVQHRVLEFSVVCAQISDLQQGFKTFDQIEKSVHRELDMREPGVDIRLHYIGGILKDEKNIRKAEKTGVPVTTLKPHSPASQCMTHIAQSLLMPTHARDPRVHFNRSLVSRIFG